jgi:hypothetical protein
MLNTSKMNYNNLTQEERDRILKSELNENVIKIIERYRLESTKDLKWVSRKENSHEHVIFTQNFLKTNDEIAALFRANYLCLAKVKYFRENINKYEPAKYLPEKGFVKTEFWDSDFLKHKASGKYIDYRFLQRITDIDVFLNFCAKLEESGTNN